MPAFTAALQVEVNLVKRPKPTLLEVLGVLQLAQFFDDDNESSFFLIELSATAMLSLSSERPTSAAQCFNKLKIGYSVELDTDSLLAASSASVCPAKLLESIFQSSKCVAASSLESQSHISAI